MTKGLDLVRMRPIGKTADGKDVLIDLEFYQFLIQLRDRTGTLATDQVAVASEDATDALSDAADAQADADAAREVTDVFGPHIDETTGRINTANGLPLGSLGGTGVVRSVAAPLSAPSASQIDVDAHDAKYVGVTYELPSANITSLSTDTIYYVFWDVAEEEYLATDDPAEAADFYTAAGAYVPLGYQRTQDGGGGYTPPPPPPPGGGGGAGGGAGGGPIFEL